MQSKTKNKGKVKAKQSYCSAQKAQPVLSCDVQTGEYDAFDNALYIPKVYEYTHNENLIKPTPIDPNLYETNIEEGKPILTLGYGALNEYSMTMPLMFERPALGDNDVLFEVSYCGICHSDWHVILNEWKMTKYPVVPGHEMTGIVIKVGNKVKKFGVGDLVALSPLYNSCLTCEWCKRGEEQYCLNGYTETYNFNERLPEDTKPPTGPLTYGGYSNLMVAHDHFLFKLPKNLPMDRSAPLLCAGMTVYNAFISCGIQAGDKLGVAGIGGLGHLLIKIAKAKGVEVVALTTTKWKLRDSIDNLGADDAVLMKDKDKLTLMKGKLDYIIDTIPFKHDLDDYLELLRPKGTLCVVGALYSLNPDFNTVIRTGKIIRGSNISGTIGTEEFLQFCSQNLILADIEKVHLGEINNTRNKLTNSEVKYRYVLDIKNSVN